MGLDMYLYKAKRVDGATLEDIRNTDEFLSYILDEDVIKAYTFEMWCGISENKIRQELVDAYKPEVKTFFYDKEKKHGYKSIMEEVGYWRKANQIHHWFVEHLQNGVDDCGDYEVTKEDVDELLAICKTVLANSKLVKGKVANGYTFENGKEKINWEDGEIIEDPTIAESLLPTRSGFFFGGTNYDQWYVMDIKNTIEILERLSDVDFEHEIVFYHSSW